MALADFYDRSAQAVSQVLQGFDPDEFRELVGNSGVVIAFGRSAATTSEGLVLLDMLTRLLSRFYPVVELRTNSDDDAVEKEAFRLTALARRINPSITLDEPATVGIAVGEDAPQPDEPLFVGSNGWDAILSAAAPAELGHTNNPFGAGAAACMGVAELFRRQFVEGWDAGSMQDQRFSTYELAHGPTPSGIPNEGWTLPGKSVLVGVGAVGNAALWALSRSPVEGELHIVDPERIELSNLQRYVLAERSDADWKREKVSLQIEPFPEHLILNSHRASWAEFVVQQGYEWDQVAVALDSAGDRRAVQASLPGWVANAWTQTGDLGVSVHGPFGGTGECLACLYHPHSKTKNEDEIVAAALGVPERLMEVRMLLQSGAAVGQPLLEAVAAARGFGIESARQYEDGPILKLYSEGICGGGVLPLGTAGVPRGELQVPLAHQSALAGVLLAAALLRHSIQGDDEESTRITRIDVMREFPEEPTRASLRRNAGTCICEDHDYQARWVTKYSGRG